MAKACSFCGSPDHTKFYCRLRPRARIQRYARIKKIGKHGYLWMEARAQWVAKFGSDHNCHYCGRAVSDDTFKVDEGLAHKLTLDHLDARSQSPELRYAERNLTPACASCNRKKGSKSHDEYPHTCYTDLPLIA